MPEYFEDFVEKVNSAKTDEELLNHFIASIKRHGLDRMILCFDTDHPHLGISAGTSVIDNISADLLINYEKNDFIKIDPVRIYSRLQPHPFYWDDIYSRMNVSKKQKHVVDVAVDSGLHTGMFFPLSKGNCRAGIGLASSEKTDNFSGQFDVINAYCNQFYEAFSRLHDKRNKDAVTEWILTPKEIQILTLAADGKTDAEIGYKLCISDNTVETHMRNIYLKLEVKNRTAAVARALVKKFITLT